MTIRNQSEILPACQYRNSGGLPSRLIPRLLLAISLCTVHACSGGTKLTDGTNTAIDQGTVDQETIDEGSADNPVDESTTGGSTIATGISAFHRSGQTFLTWREPSPQARYHVYRHDVPINANTISSATRLTSKWGSLGPDTSLNTHGTEYIPANFVIQDLGTALSDDTGLFVYTVPEDQQGSYYYSVTTVIDGVEHSVVSPSDNSLSTAIDETSNTPRPVLVVSTNEGKARIYQQYADYSNWNPTFNGYAYEFGVTLPFNYNPSISYPVQLVLHAFGQTYKNPAESQSERQVIWIHTSDPGSDQDSTHSWWYGYASDHNYEITDLPPSQGTVTNFTEQRVLASVRFVLDSPEFNSNNDLTHIVGASMGASGALSMALRYPNVFSGIYASQPMTNYQASPSTKFQANFVSLWGAQQSNLPIVNGGASSNLIRKYGLGQSDETGVWDWMNHFQQLRRRAGEDFAYLMIDHGKADDVIDWETQGQPLTRALTDAKAGFSANAYEGVEHIWLAYSAVIKSMFGLGFGDFSQWRYPLSLSYPAIQNASGSASIDPGTDDDSSYNMDIEWSIPANSFGSQIVDATDRYEITLRSTESDQTADITPRRTQQFKPSAGQQCRWSAIKLADGSDTSGNATVAGNDLITVIGVPVYSDPGTRLTINCQP